MACHLLRLALPQPHLSVISNGKLLALLEVGKFGKLMYLVSLLCTSELHVFGSPVVKVRTKKWKPFHSMCAGIGSGFLKILEIQELFSFSCSFVCSHVFRLFHRS